MSNPFELKEFVRLIVETWEKWKYFYLAQEISHNLTNTYKDTQDRYQIILNAKTKKSIIDMMKRLIDEDQYSDPTTFFDHVIEALESKLGQKLY